MPEEKSALKMLPPLYEQEGEDCSSVTGILVEVTSEVLQEQENSVPAGVP